MQVMKLTLECHTILGLDGTRTHVTQVFLSMPRVQDGIIVGRITLRKVIHTLQGKVV